MIKNSSTHRTQVPPTSLRFFLIVLLLLGIFFRFANLDKKIYGLDETFSSLRISGYTEAELVQELSIPRIISVKDIQKYQRTNSQRNALGTIKGLSSEEPQHPPLYYTIAQFWNQLFGDSVAVTRSLPALLSLLAFPAIYWLCLELFDSSLTGWIAIAFLAVSPFHVVYAQEARQYSLWAVTILLSSAALLRAMRVKTKMSWLIYTLTLATGFYTFLLSILVAIGQGIYVATIERLRLTKVSVAYLISSFLGGLAFLPWIIIVKTNFSSVQNTTNWNPQDQITKWDLVRGWMRHPYRPFFDLNLSTNDPIIHRILQMFFTVTCLILVGYTFYFLVRTTHKQIWLFVFTLVGTTGIGLIFQDVILGGQGGGSSLISRYVIPCYLGFQLAFAHLFAYVLTSGSGKLWQQKFWQVALVVLLSGGVFSCTISTQSQVWWNKGGPEYLLDNLAAAQIINKSPAPLLVSDSNTWSLMFISHILDPKVRLLVRPNCFSCRLPPHPEFNPTIPQEAAGFSDIFLFPEPSDGLIQRIENQQNYNAKLVPLSASRKSLLRRLEKKS